MARTAVHFMFLCFVLISAFLPLAASEYRLFNSRNQLKDAGAQYVESTDMRKRDADYLLNNKCKFIIVEKTIFYACPKRPTRYPSLQNKVFSEVNGNDDRNKVYADSQKFECPFSFGTYPHPKDCRKYYLCLFDKPRTMTCESSKLYDEYKGECAKNSTVDCGDRTGDVTTKGTTLAPGQQTTSAVKTTTKKVQKFTCPYTWGTFPNPDDCSQYYLCLNKRHTLKKCKPTELYDTKKQECRDEDDVDCESRFNPREKTTKPVTSITTTTTVTTTKEEITSDVFEKSTSQSSSSGATSDQEATESSSAGVPSSSESSATLTSEVKSTTIRITSQEPAQSTEGSTVTDDGNSGTVKPEPTSEKPRTTNEDNLGSEEPKPEPTFEKPRTTVDTSKDREPDSTSEKPEITDDGAINKPQTTEETPGSVEPEPSSSEKSTTSDEGTDTKEPGLTSEKPRITDDNASGTEELEPTPEKPRITDDDTSESDQPEEISGKPEITNDDTLTREESELTSEGTSEVPVTSQPTEDDSSPEPDITDSKSTSLVKFETTDRNYDQSEDLGITDASNLTKEPQSTNDFTTADTIENETLSEESEAPEHETTPAGDLSSVPDDNTNPNEAKSTDGDGKSDYTTEVDTTSQPESTVDDGASSEEPHSPKENKISTFLPYRTPSVDYDNTDDEIESSSHPETTAKEGITPKTSQSTVDKREISSNQVETSTVTSSESPKSFECPKKKGNYAHEYDCSLYYACRGGNPKIRKCPSGTLFHSIYGMCYNEENVDCGDRKKDEQSTLIYISTTSAKGRQMTETIDDINISSEISKSFDSTDKTADYTISEILEMQSTSNFNTENDFTSARNTETSGISKTDEIIVETSESPNSTIQEITVSTEVASTENNNRDTSESLSTLDDVTKDVLSSVDQENTETSSDYSTAETTSTYSTGATPETYGTKDTQDTNKDELSTQSITGDNEHWTSGDATEKEIVVSSVEGQSTPLITETTYSDPQKETTVNYTDVSIIGTEPETHSTSNTEETLSSNIHDIEISTMNITIFTTDEPSTHNNIDEEDTSHRTSAVRTTVESISSELPMVSTKEISSSLMPRITTQPTSEKSVIPETTEGESYESLETTRQHLTRSTKITSITKNPDTTTHSQEEIIASTKEPKSTCYATDNTCIVDEDGNIFRCPKSHGHFPHPWDISKFLQCDNFRIHVIDCPAGLRFDPKYMICTWAAALKG